MAKAKKEKMYPIHKLVDKKLMKELIKGSRFKSPGEAQDCLWAQSQKRKGKKK